MAAGAPRKYDRKDLLEKLQEYIKNTDMPIVSEFAYKYGIPREYLYQMSKDEDELSYTIKSLINKKEYELERGGLTGKYNPSMAIFSLKQLGWKDRQDIDLKGEMENKTVIQFEVFKPKKKKK